MTREEEIKELEAEFRDALNPFNDDDIEYRAWRMVKIDGWRRQIEAEWTLNRDGNGTCSNCHFTQRGVYDQDSYQRYCGHCGARMKLKGEK